MKINKETIQKLNPLFQAIAEGKAIQVESGDDWMDIDFGGEGVNASTLITCPECYRIKPEVKYRPFKDAEECWAEMLKHQPFGWMIPIGINQKINLTVIGNGCDSEALFKKFTFADGTPFGIKVEE